LLCNCGSKYQKWAIAYEVFCCQNLNEGAYSFKLAHIGLNTICFWVHWLRQPPRIQAVFLDLWSSCVFIPI